MKKNLFLIFLIYSIFKPSISFSLVEIDITRGNLDPMPISVSPFFSNEDTRDKIENILSIRNLGLEISKVIENNFNLSPRGIREMLKLNNPIYEITSAYGHFGRKPTNKGEFTWEKTDKIDLFKL